MNIPSFVVFKSLHNGSCEQSSLSHNQNLKITATSKFPHQKTKDQKPRRTEFHVLKTEIEHVFTYSCTSITICSSFSFSPTNPPLLNLSRRSPIPRFRVSDVSGSKAP